MVATTMMHSQQNPERGAQTPAGTGISRQRDVDAAGVLAGRAPLASESASCVATIDFAGLFEGLAPEQSSDARHRNWKLGSLALCRVVTRATRYGRTAAQIRRDLLDDWLVCVATCGVHKVRIGGACTTVPPRVPIILSLDEPFEMELRGAEWLCLIMPRDSRPELAPAIDRCRCAPLASAPGRLLSGFLQRVAAELPRMREAEIPRAVEATRALVAAAVSAGATPGLVDDAVVRAAQLARVRAIIRQHLQSPDLTPNSLCLLASMSRSQLYRLFEPVGGVRRAILRERLRQAHRAITDPNDRRTIQAIGDELGFLEPTTFSRAFRREFGYAPGTLRRMATPEPLPSLRTGGVPAVEDSRIVSRLG
jgi:AraC-like DNA-binding protein